MQLNGVQKRALLMGSAWTLALAAVFFKSAPLPPIYVWILCILAFGWAGVVLHALAVERRAADVSVAAAGGETRAVVDDLAQVLGAEMRRARDELERVDELLAHAIEQLMSVFNSVSDQASNHLSELRQAAAAAEGTPGAERMRVAAERVALEVNGAVTALQFRDVVGQKLGHVRRELEALERVMTRIREASAEQTVPAPVAERGPEVSEMPLARRVQGLLMELERSKAASPVKQELMHAGEVELF